MSERKRKKKKTREKRRESYPLKFKKISQTKGPKVPNWKGPLSTSIIGPFQTLGTKRRPQNLERKDNGVIHSQFWKNMLSNVEFYTHPNYQGNIQVK